MLNRAVLVLNASYEPINICSAKRAFTLLAKGKAVMEQVSTNKIHTSQREYLVPSVIRAIEYRRIPRQVRAVSRKGIFLRDNMTCQYCAKKFQAGDLTLDHVIPKSRSGQHSWTNLTTSCFGCNNRKGDRTPEEAGMTLLRKPSAVTIHAKNRMLSQDSEGLWDAYLFC